MSVRPKFAFMLHLNHTDSLGWNFAFIVSKSIEALRKVKHPKIGSILPYRMEIDLDAHIQYIVLSDAATFLGDSDVLFLSKKELDYISVDKPKKNCTYYSGALKEAKAAHLKHRISLANIFMPNGDAHCIPKPQLLPTIDMQAATQKKLHYYFDGTCCPSGHVDVKIFKHRLPRYIKSAEDLCRTCAEALIKEVCYWRTEPHWRTEPDPRIQRMDLNPDLHMKDIGPGYLNPDQYKTSFGKFPLPFNINFISKHRASLMGLHYYFPDTLCPRSHIDIRTMEDDCISCLNEERCIAKGQKFRPEIRQYYGPEQLASYKNITKCSAGDAILTTLVPGKPVTVTEIRDLSSRILSHAKKNTIPSGIDVESILGYNIQELRYSLESKFKDGMSWKNIGVYWAMDHVIPVQFLKEQGLLYPKVVNHLSNLEPLCSKANSSKSANIHRDRLIEFRLNVLAPMGLDFKPGWESNRRIVDAAYWNTTYRDTGLSTL